MKRISKDMQEITKNPIEGIGIIQYENDFMKYIINIKLMHGIYKGFCLQLLLTFNDNYPTNPPKILLFPGQNFDHIYHHHVFNDQDGFYKFCFDLLENDFMKTNEEHSGWNPSYTISSLLIQVQNFLCDPDMHHLPTEFEIQKFFLNMKNYERKFTDSNGNTIIHTWDSPYPKMFFGEENKNNENSEKINGEKNENKIINEDEKKEKEELIRLNEIKENLTCFMLKLNYIEDPDILLGYPIVQKKGMGRNFKIELYPIPELLTYDGFIAQIGKKDEKLDFYFDVSFKSANNEFYNYWVPIYIDKNHFEKNKEAILNSFSIIKFGPIGLKEYDFKVDYIFEVIPIILNKMIIGIFSKKSSLSEAFIKCYFQYILLFKKLTEIYKKEFNDYVSKIIKQIEKNYYKIDKKIIPDIGNFMVLLLFSDINISDKIWNSLFDEFSIRQMYWIFHGPDNENSVKLSLIKYGIPIEKINEVSNKNEVLKKVIFEGMVINSLDTFKLLCDMNNIYDKIIEILKEDKNLEKWMRKLDLLKYENMEEIISKNFCLKLNDYIQKCTIDSKNKLYSLIDESIITYDNLKLCFSKENLDSFKSDYDKNKVDEILKEVDPKYHDSLLNQFYSSQKGNKLLIISYTARKKIKSKGFLEELEKNYGVLLNVSDFIKEIQINLKEINSYKKLFEFVDCDLIKDLSEYEYIIKTYGKSKKKKYIKTYFEPINNLVKKNNENEEEEDDDDEDDDEEEEGWVKIVKKKIKKIIINIIIIIIIIIQEAIIIEEIIIEGIIIEEEVGENRIINFIY